MNFEDITFPHIMYISDDGERIGLWYLGDEPEENHSRLPLIQIICILLDSFNNLEKLCKKKN
jgi:hypothetical protein